MKICVYPPGWQSRLRQNVGAYRPWLLDHGSLTRRIMARCTAFQVRRVRMDKGWAAVEGEPCRAVLREVFLTCSEIPVVYAHSVLPLASLRGPWRLLGKLGGRPLGDILFRDPRVQRAPLEFKKLNRRHWLYRRASRGLESAPAALWARRSTFTLRGRAIQVTEVFLPAIRELPR